MSEHPTEVLAAYPPTEGGPKSPTKFCHAVVEYLSAINRVPLRDDEVKNAFTYLVNICDHVVGHLYTNDGEPSVYVDYGPDRRWEISRRTGTRFFIAQFLLERLAPFRHFSREQLEVAAVAGTFRGWPTLCRWRLTDRVRKQYRRPEPTFSVGTGTELEILYRILAGDSNPNDSDAVFKDVPSASAERMPSDFKAQGEWPSYQKMTRWKQDALKGAPLYRLDADALRTWYASKGPTLNALLEASEQITLQAIVDAGAPQGSTQVKVVAKAQGVTERSARNHIVRLAARMKDLMRTRFELFEELGKAVKLVGFHDHKGHRVKPAKEN